jgi:hypothetical protein
LGAKSECDRTRPGAKEAMVNDPIISHFLQKPVKATVKADNAARITFTWELPFIRNREAQTTARFLYRASYFKKTGKVIISANPVGYVNNFNAYGTCKLH